MNSEKFKETTTKEVDHLGLLKICAISLAFSKNFCCSIIVFRRGSEAVNVRHRKKSTSHISRKGMQPPDLAYVIYNTNRKSHILNRHKSLHEIPNHGISKCVYQCAQAPT